MSTNLGKIVYKELKHIYQKKIIAYAFLCVISTHALIGIASAQSTQLRNSSDHLPNTVQSIEPVRVSEVYSPAKSLPIIQTTEVTKVAIANQVALEQRDAAVELIAQQKKAEEKRIAVEKRKAEEARIAAEKAAAEALRKLKGEPGENYPWANASYYSDSADPWGMYKRQCVSYAAWKVASSGRVMPMWSGHGDAYLWDENARASGIPVDSTPRIADVAVDNSGYYGHVMFVEEVYGDGTILVSQYNADGAGHYSVERRTSSGLSFIHF